MGPWDELNQTQDWWRLLFSIIFGFVRVVIVLNLSVRVVV